jgi:hypothetical protein
MTDAWQPLETAPSLEEVFVLMPAFGSRTHDPIALVAYKDSYGLWYRLGIFEGDEQRSIHTPLCWMAIPHWKGKAA